MLEPTETKRIGKGLTLLGSCLYSRAQNLEILIFWTRTIASVASGSAV